MSRNRARFATATIGVTALAVATAVTGVGLASTAQAAAGPAVSVWETTTNQSQLLAPQTGSAFAAGGSSQSQVITVDPTTDAVTLRAIFPNPSGFLLPGMFLRATVIEGVNPAGLLVPQQGVTRDQKGEATALVLGRQDLVELRHLQVGQTVGSKWLVTSGLAAGDRLIVEGGQSAQPGAKARAFAADNLQ